MTTNTPDLDVAGTVAEIHTGQGYVVLPGLLPSDRAATIRNQILACAEHDKAHDRLIMQNGRWRVRLVGRGDIFMELAVHGAITRIAEAMLGAGFVMGGLSAHTITAGAPPQGRPCRLSLLRHERALPGYADATAGNLGARCIHGRKRRNPRPAPQPENAPPP